MNLAIISILALLSLINASFSAKMYFQPEFFGSGQLKISVNSKLTDISNLSATDGNFIVGDGTTWVAESGATLRTSVGVGTGDSPTLTGLTLSGVSDGSVVYSVAGVLTATSTANLKTTLKLNNVENTALSSWGGSTNLATVGTITSGTWTGNTIGLGYGGSNATSYGANRILFVNSGNTAFSSAAGFTYDDTLSKLTLSYASTTAISGTNLSLSGKLEITNSATSTIAGQLDVAGNVEADRIQIVGNATSTASNGFNVSAGCFAINGTCVGGGGSTADWKFLSATTTSVAMWTPTVDVSSASSTEYRIIIGYPLPPTTMGLSLRFNNDIGNNYDCRDSFNGAADVSCGSKAQMEFNKNNTVASASEYEIDIINHYSSPKSVFYRNIRYPATIAAPDRGEGMGWWINSTSTITSFQLLNSTGNNVPAGTRIRVWYSNN